MSPRRSLLPTSTTVSVDNERCHLYGFCQAAAPALFELTAGERLRYVSHVTADHEPQVRDAARQCPMQAIRLSGQSTD
jgi:ferredoxin